MPKENKCLLSKKAAIDIANIADYMINKFGLKQAGIYRDGLIKTFEFLVLKPELGRDFILNNGVVIQRFNYKFHIIFYRQTTVGVLIIRILGDRMNFQKHLR